MNIIDFFLYESICLNWLMNSTYEHGSIERRFTYSDVTTTMIKFAALKDEHGDKIYEKNF